VWLPSGPMPSAQHDPACVLPLSITAGVLWAGGRQPAVVEISILRVGQLVLLCVPGEFSTMAGRRLREAVAEAVRHAWGAAVRVVIAGLTNTYSSYVVRCKETKPGQ
jgi:Neutral/alkaline non-lysosomal ceramidase, N-terminal